MTWFVVGSHFGSEQKYKTKGETPASAVATAWEVIDIDHHAPVRVEDEVGHVVIEEQDLRLLMMTAEEARP
jgi:hypothetical protein